MDMGRPAWIEVDLAAIDSNLRRIREHVGSGCGVLAVVKANAYGHGLVSVARAALDAGAVGLAVACLPEAWALRAAGLTAPILVLGMAMADEAEEALALDVASSFCSRPVAEAFSAAAVRRGAKARLHLKVDTGMGRAGVAVEEAPALLREIRALPGLSVEALFTHFATADEPDLEFACEQLRQFHRCMAVMRREGTLPAQAHAANSAAVLRLTEAYHSFVRPGLMLYGIPPYPEAERQLALRAALSLKARLVSVKSLPRNAGVGYGHSYRMEHPGRIAIVPLGYGDGFSRHNSNNGQVLLRGRRVPIRGRICMDQFMVDVTDVPEAAVGDEVVLIGRQGDEAITADEVARRTGTIAYETVAALTERLPRRYQLA